MFQLVLTDKLRTQLASIEQDQLVVQDAATDKMQKMQKIEIIRTAVAISDHSLVR